MMKSARPRIKIATHALTRCIFCELQFQNRLVRDEYKHWDQICDQLYFDALGYGINGKARPWIRKI